jgi:type IV secretion system protein TrbI
MAETEPNHLVTPQVQDKRTQPAGIVPRNAQLWLLIGVALVMVLVIAFSGRNPPKDRRASATPQAPTAVEPNTARIQEYQKGIDEITRRLKAQQEQAVAQQSLGTPPIGAEATRPYPGPNSSIYGPAYESRYARIEPNPEDNAIQADKRKREYQSLFASNVALTYRHEAQAAQDPAGAALAWARTPPLPGYPYILPPPQVPDFGLPPSAYMPPTAHAQIAAAPTALQRADEKNSEAGATKGRGAERDAEINRADGKLYRLFEGTVIETVLTNRLDGEFSGPVNCMVTTNIYSRNGQRLLIPQGTRVLGEVRRVESFGQQRLAVGFHRLVMPDGYSVSLDKFQGLNQVGETGLRDQVNHHYLQMFGTSIAIGALAGLSQANTRYGIDQSAADAYRQGVAASLSQSSLHILDRFLNVLPTFTIREGHRVKVYLSDDLLVPGYEQHQMPSDL